MTAEEFWHDISVQSTLDMYGNYSQWDIQSAMIEFARLKVQEALEAAADKAYTKTIIPIESGCMMYTDAYETVDKDSILQAYDLNSII